MPCFTSRRTSLYYEVQGTGPTLLLSHGAIENTEAWTDTVLILRNSFRTITYDARGRGRSQSSEPFTLSDLAADVHALAEHLGLSRFFHAGHSLGGRIALEHAATYPDEVAAVAAISARVRTLKETRKRAYTELMARTRSMGSAASAEMWIRPEEPLYERVRSISGRNSVEGTLRTLDCIIQNDSVVPNLNDVKAPVLVLAGARDLTYIDDAKDMYAGLPNARLRILESAGHFPNLECPEVLARELGEYFTAFA